MNDAIVSKRSVFSVAKLRTPGYVDAVRQSATRETDKHFVIPRDKYEALCKAFRGYDVSPPDSPPDSGPGTELKKLLKLIGISASPTCSCNARAREMDKNGCDWCEANLDTIVGWLREEATKRGLPFVDLAGRLLVKRAIRNARKAAS
jgi:hypothetical protein